MMADGDVTAVRGSDRRAASLSVLASVGRSARAIVLGALVAAAGLALVAAPVHAQTVTGGAEVRSGSAPAAGVRVAGTLFLAPERIALEDGRLLHAERGVLYVPAIRSDPEESGVIGIEIYRFPRQPGVAADALPVFLLHGGPGFPGLGPSLERPGYYERRLRPWTEVGDLVVVGQRGIGTSRPNTVCEAPERPPLDQVVSETEAEAALQAALAACRQYWEAKGAALQGFNVVEAAADVAAVAEALGYERLVLQGTSFGSHWAMAVLRYHPEIVARALLSGMEGPDHTYDMPSGVLGAMTRFGTAAERALRLETRLPEGGLVAALRQVVERVEREPIEAETEDPETGERVRVRFGVRKVQALAYGYAGHTSGRDGIRTWPADVLRLYDGDFRGAAETLLRRWTERDYSTASFWMLDCGSGISETRRTELERDPALAVLGTGWAYRAGCPVWETDLGVAFRRNFETEVPTVIVQGTWDTSTPVENARELAPYFERSAYVEVEGGSHGALWEALDADEEFRRKVFEFMRTGELSGFPERIELPPLEWEVPEGTDPGAAGPLSANPPSLCAPADGADVLWCGRDVEGHIRRREHVE